MSEITRKRNVLVGLVLGVLLAWGGAALAQTGNLAKIDFELQERMHYSRDANETYRVIIEMTEQYDNYNLERNTVFMTRAQRRDYVVNELKRFSESSQADVEAFLTEQGTRGHVNVLHRFWIFNGLYCEATADCIGKLSMRHDVRYVSMDRDIQIIDPEEDIMNRDNPPEGIQWHVSKVRADEVWNYNGTSGYTGAGVVIAIIDSGVNYNHVDISANMWDGGERYPHHGWDFYNNDNDPMDDYGHGSHVAGIAAGNEAIYKIGIAPNAKIMSLKVLNEHNATEGTYGTVLAIQFAVENGADIINISVGWTEGGYSVFRDAFVNVLNAGVVAAVSAGNNGDEQSLYPIPYNVMAPGNCPPPWHNPDQVLIGGASAVICVGNTNQNDIRFHDSSIGPVTWAQGSNIGDYQDYPYQLPLLKGLIRPDVSAPGTDIWSIDYSSNVLFCQGTGTSMSTPCVSGVIALMLEANPNLTPAQIDEILETTAVPCENQTGKNNYYGAGRVDAYAAVTAALNMNTTQHYHISVAKYPFDNRFEVTGTGHYPMGSSCTITASPIERFDRWEKDGEIVSTSPNYTINYVTENADYTGFFFEHEVNIDAFPSEGGVTNGGGFFHAGDQCTVTATPNLGFTFMGWYNNALGTILYSRQPEYTFTVSNNRNLVAKFVLGSYNVTTTCSPANGGVVSGNQGSYTAGSMVTLTATANTGYVFSCWTEDGQVISNQPTYSFQIRSDRHLVANFMNLSFSIGDVITNPDGSKGVVFYINPTYMGGCMVALEDASTGCKWGNSGDVTFLRNYTWTRNECQLSDLDGYANTAVLRDYQPTNDNYASGIVNYANGWYVPSAGQLRKLFGALPFIELSISSAGGTLLAENANYWSSTEHTESNAWTASFEMVSASKTSNYRVRAVHDFSVNNTMRVVARTNDTELGSVTGTGFYANGATVTVTATPSGGNLFRGWTEAGHLVSLNPTYTFTANANRNLVANFAIRGGVGTLVTNPDGSQGILFYLNEDGSQGLMVALEDASEGCQWGPSTDIGIMKDRSINNQRMMEDQFGYHNTQLIRLSQGTNNNYAASIVDFENGWYLPSAGQLRKLYATLPIIEEAIIKAGGSIMTSGKYWSSTEYSSSYVSTPGFEISYTSKTSNCRVRAIRNYIPDGDYVVSVSSNNESYGSVSGSGTFAMNQTVTVTATPNAGYQFDHWTEDGATVSYDASYQFPFTRSRSLVAHFVVPGSVGSVVTNADGSRGVVFYKDPSGNGCLMVALEDVSSGCAWGASQDVTTLENLNPSQVQSMLEDQNGYANTQVLRDWQQNNANYAAGKVDFANGWYLPSTGELRKLYAALPLIEEAIVCAGGTLLSGSSYWSSSECSSSQAWSPSFEFTKSNKTSNLRVRAIREINTPISPTPINQTGILSQGWNWCSFNVETTLEDLQAALVAALGANASITIKSQTQNCKLTRGVWTGQLTTLDLSRMYNISVNANCEITLVGMAVNPEEHPVTINSGANWIAFPLSESMSITEAFGAFGINGDVIKSQLLNCRNTRGVWTGQLNTLEPGKGYIYNSAAANTRTFTFPTNAK